MWDMIRLLRNTFSEEKQCQTFFKTVYFKITVSVAIIDAICPKLHIQILLHKYRPDIKGCPCDQKPAKEAIFIHEKLAYAIIGNSVYQVMRVTQVLNYKIVSLSY